MAGYTGIFARVVNGISYFPTPLLESSLEGIVLFSVLFWKKKRIDYS